MRVRVRVAQRRLALISALLTGKADSALAKKAPVRRIIGCDSISVRIRATAVSNDAPKSRGSYAGVEEKTWKRINDHLVQFANTPLPAAMQKDLPMKLCERFHNCEAYVMYSTFKGSVFAFP